MSTLSWLLVALFSVVIILGIIGLFKLIISRLRREQEGDVFLMNKDSQRDPLPIELRGERDYRYKDANVNPYEKK